LVGMKFLDAHGGAIVGGLVRAEHLHGVIEADPLALGVGAASVFREEEVGEVAFGLGGFGDGWHDRV